MKLLFNKLFFAVLLLSVVSFTASCTNDKDDEHNENTAIITIASPTEGANFHHGASIDIIAEIVGKEALHGYEVYLRNKADNTVLHSINSHTHDKTLTIHETWVNNVAMQTDVELEIVVFLDHDGSKTNKKVSIHCHP